MKYYNEKIKNFIEWMSKSGGEGKEPVYIIPKASLFELYRMENPGIGELTDDELKYLKLLQENLLFQKGLKGTIVKDFGKLNLADEFGWSERVQKKEEGPVDYVTFDLSGMFTENTAVHDTLNLENEALKQKEDK